MTSRDKLKKQLRKSNRSTSEPKELIEGVEMNFDISKEIFDLKLSSPKRTSPRKLDVAIDQILNQGLN